MSKEIYLKAFIAALSEKPTSKEKKLIERAYNFGYEACLAANEDEEADRPDEEEESEDDYDCCESCDCCGSDDPDDDDDSDDINEPSGDTEFYEVQDSSVISALFYDFDTRILQVELKDGKAYDYYDVDATTFKEFKTSSSKGAYFNQFKQQYDFDEA